MRSNVISETHGFLLARGGVVAREGHAGAEVRVSRGALWLTQEGDLRDIVVTPEAPFRLDRPGRVVLQVLADAEVQLETPARRAPRRIHVAARTARAALGFLQGAVQAARAAAPRVSANPF